MLLTCGRWLAHAMIALVLIGSLAQAPAAAQTPARGEPLAVVATFSILGDLVRQVGGDAVQVTTLIGPGVDAHTYDPAPADLVALSEADVIFENGLGFEPWLDGFFASTQPRARGSSSATASRRARRASTVKRARMQAPRADDHGAFDPHVWHDVANAIVMTENIRDALVAADPANAAVYEANADGIRSRSWKRSTRRSASRSRHCRRSGASSSPPTTRSATSPTPTGSRWSARRSARSRPKRPIPPRATCRS